MSKVSLVTYNSFLDATAQNLADFLRGYVNNIELHYSWDFDLKKVPSSIEFEWKTLPNWYLKTVQLKRLVTEKLSACQDFDERFPVAQYFVVEWGGVGTNKSLREKLENFDQVISVHDIKTLDGVSSWSKYLSLRNSDAAIYDSRVAYAINAINYLNDFTDFFFPMPAGRSPKLSLLDLDTLFLLSKLKENSEFITYKDKAHRQISSRIKNRYYLPEEITYRTYLDLLNRTANKLELSAADKHKIEMLLFALAPGEIFNALIDKKTKLQRGENI